MSYSRKSVDQSEYEEQENRKVTQYYRSKHDNPYLLASQITNIQDYVNEKTVNVVDADTLAFQVASSVEDDYIEVVNLTTKTVVEMKNVTEFKGRVRSGFSSDSWLGNENLKREAENKTPYTLEDYEITPKKRLKHEKGATVDDLHFETSMDVLKYYVDSWVKAIKVQTTVERTLFILGEGDVHRHDLLLPKPYKDGRSGERPLLLKAARMYILNEYVSKMAPKGFEADEIVDTYGKKGYEAYKATGVFSFIKSSPDKDAGNKEGILFNYDKSFTFKIPQPMMIKSMDEDVGEIAIDKDKIRGVGLKHMCYQLIIGDSADTYGPRTYLPEELRPKVKYASTGFYKDFYALPTQKEVLQKLVDIYHAWFPEGIAYTAWNGVEAEFDTLGYLELMFSCAYMKESPKDSTKIEDALIQFDVDYKKIVGNRITHDTPLVGDDILKELVHETKTLIEEAMSEVEQKTGTKPVLVAKLERTESLLKETTEKLRSMFATGG